MLYSFSDTFYRLNMLSLTIVIGLVAVLLTYIYYTQFISKFGQMVNKFPGPKALPILGNILDIYTTPVNIFIRFRKFAATYTGTYRFWNGHYAAVNIVTAEDAEILLTSRKHIKKHIIYEFIHGWLGTGLLTSTGKKWQHRRKLLTPAFHFNILRKFTECFGEHSLKLVEDLKKECTKQEINVIPYITHTTLQAICDTAMGTSLDPENKIQQSYIKSLHDMAYIALNRTMSPWLYSNITFNMLPIGWKHNKIIKSLHKFTATVIRDRESNFKDSDLENLDKTDKDDIMKKKRLAMLDLLISEKKNKGSIDDDGIREEVDTFMFAGHDTISVGISLALMVLANQKEHQEKIVEELEGIFGDSKRAATYEDLQKMPYLELCLKESLRLFPSVPLIGRKIEEDLQLSTFIVPPGTYLNIHIYDLHRDPRQFPNPTKYDPERFLPENSRGRHPFAYIPFSAGPRNCIGQKFAMLEMKSIISAVLRNYVLEPVDTPETMHFKIDFVLRNEGDINVKFRPRV